ncbi:hypothetical protein AXF21_02150 [Eubacterium minutum ATCC 700079]|nr:hypothetical protein AXF21_02150 [Eubacterium minutum ATCC 700079]
MRKYIAEFIGTFVLVAFGCGSAVAANSIFISMGSPLPIAFTSLPIAFAFGLAFIAMAYSMGKISGSHLNPAVSLAMLIARRLSLKDFFGYVIGQFAGSTAAALFLWTCFSAKDALGQNGYGTSSPLGINVGIAALVETVLSAVFILVFLSATSKKECKALSGLVIGLTLTVTHIFGIPFTGASVNPARSFAPAVFVGGDALNQLPVFIIAPFAGGIVAALLYILLFNIGRRDVMDADIEDDSVVQNAEAESADAGIEDGIIVQVVETENTETDIEEDKKSERASEDEPDSRNEERQGDREAEENDEPDQEDDGEVKDDDGNMDSVVSEKEKGNKDEKEATDKKAKEAKEAADVNDEFGVDEADEESENYEPEKANEADEESENHEPEKANEADEESENHESEKANEADEESETDESEKADESDEESETDKPEKAD